MKKNILFFSFLCLMLLGLSSCSSERRALSQMRTLTENVERNGDNYSVQEWKDAYDQFKEIDASIDQQKLTPQQKEEYTEMQGRCLKQFASSSVSNIVSAAKSIMAAGSSFLQGILKGLSK